MIKSNNFLLQPGNIFHFSDHSPRITPQEPKKGYDQMSSLVEEDWQDELSIAQEKLYASDSHAILFILEGLAGYGFDMVARKVFTSLNPQGCQVCVFHKPSDEELGHTFLWRYIKALPKQGGINIFKQSYYDEVIPWRQVEKTNLTNNSPTTWVKMCDEINNFESHLSNHSTKIIKAFVHLSKEEQKQRFLMILTDPKERWKFNQSYLSDRADWESLHLAWEDIINATNTTWAPWYMLPGDDIQTLNSLVCELLTQSIVDLGVDYPEIPPEELVEFEESRKRLLAEK